MLTCIGKLNLMRLHSYRILVSVFAILVVVSCSKKIQPSQTVEQTAIKNDTVVTIKKADSLIVVKPVAKRKPKESIPKVMVVNDKYAKRSVDGRLYYDLQGHRYWRSNKDGKYYLFNKSMLTDKAFKKPN